MKSAAGGDGSGAQAQFKLAKDSNGGNYTLDETNDPVLTRVLPAGRAARLLPSVSVRSDPDAEADAA